MKEIICKKCGEKNDYGYVRCEQCGAKLNYDESYVAKSEEDNQVESTFDTFDSFFVNITSSVGKHAPIHIVYVGWQCMTTLL